MSGPWKRGPVHPSVLVIKYFLEKLHTLKKSNIYNGVDQRLGGFGFSVGRILASSIQLFLPSNIVQGKNHLIYDFIPASKTGLILSPLDSL